MSSSRDVNPYLLTLPQLISAKAKIGKVSAFYDPQKTSLQGFDVLALSPTEFREQLRRNMAIKLTDAELGAIVMLFDTDGDGKIGSVEFVNEFLKLGVEKKKKMHLLHQKICEQHENNQRKIALVKKKQVERLTKAIIADSWTEEDEHSAMKKLGNVAFGYDSLKGGLEGFYAVISLTVIEFKEQLRRNFSLVLTSPEASAIVHIVDEHGNGSVNCKLFIDFFFRLKSHETNKHHERQVKLNNEHHMAELQHMMEVDEKFKKLVVSKTSPATEDDKLSMLAKFRYAAFAFKKNIFVDVIEKAFESEDLSPTAFQNLVQRNFEIHLSPGELDAAICLFDDNEDGAISCVEFKVTFFKLAMMERTRILAKKIFTEQKRRREAIEKEQALMKKMMDSIRTSVEWPVLPPIDDGDDGVSFTSGSVLTAGQLGADDGDDCSVGSWSAGGGLDAQGNPMTSATRSQPQNSSRKPRKLSMMDILGGDKEAAKLASTKSSITKLYPKASQDTKDFLIMLEQEEQELAEKFDGSIAEARSGRSRQSKDTKRENRVSGLQSSNSSLTTTQTDRSLAQPRKSGKQKKQGTNSHFDQGLQPNVVLLQPLPITKMGKDGDSLEEMFNSTGDLPVEERSDLQEVPPPPNTASTGATDEYYDQEEFDGTEHLSRPNTTPGRSRPASNN